MSIKNLIDDSTACFIIPYFPTGKNSRKFLDETLKGIFNQTDDNWHIIIIDDASPISEKKYLDDLHKKDKITVIYLQNNVGQGVCRNIGVSYAKKMQCPIILFNDADDISHPNRLKTVREIFKAEGHVGLIYSTVKIIDENNDIQSARNLSPSILEILKSHHDNPVEGYHSWVRIGTETGYTNKTSSTAVRTNIAYDCPFPSERISEDSHAWMRISANGAFFKYVSTIPTLYRIPSYISGQTSRDLVGNDVFNKTKVRVDADGFNIALNIAVSKGDITPEQIPKLKSKFYQRLSETMSGENEDCLMKELSKSIFYYEEINDIYSKQSFYLSDEGLKE